MPTGSRAMPQELIVDASWANTIFEATEPSAASRSAASTSAPSQPGSGTASLFSVATYREPVARMPRLFPAAKPRFVGLRMSRTDGYALATRSAEPSREPLSTTTVSKSRKAWRASASRQAARCFRPFQVTTTTLTRGDAALLMGRRSVWLNSIGAARRRCPEPRPLRRIAQRPHGGAMDGQQALSSAQDARRALPSVGRLLETAAGKALLASHAHPLVVEAIRGELDAARRSPGET